MVRPHWKFFHPRLIHFRSHYEQTPGLILVDWTDPILSRRQRMTRYLLYKIRQGRHSPLGMSKLPLELLDSIFRELCGKEIHAVRLVCAEWERASRPFFADLHLQRSMFWPTGADFRRLERFARRFGPYMHQIYITEDHFSLSGLRGAWARYVEHRDYLQNHTAAKGRGKHLRRQQQTDDDDLGSRTRLIGYLHEPHRAAKKPGSEYFRHAYQQRQPLSPWKTLRLYTFLWQYLCNTISQACLCLTGQDRRSLARIAKMLPHGRLEAVNVSYAADELNKNVYVYGRAAPGFAMELAVLCGNGQEEVLGGEGYGRHVERAVGEAMAGRAR